MMDTYVVFWHSANMLRLMPNLDGPCSKNSVSIMSFWSIYCLYFYLLSISMTSFIGCILGSTMTRYSAIIWSPSEPSPLIAVIDLTMTSWSKICLQSFSRDSPCEVYICSLNKSGCIFRRSATPATLSVMSWNCEAEVEVSSAIYRRRCTNSSPCERHLKSS